MNRDLLAFTVLWVFGPAVQGTETLPETDVHSSAAALYQTHCADCHGAEGEGVAGEFDDPLIGDWTIERLARKIDRTMPEDDPDAVVGADAQAIAAFIYQDFYSVEAQKRRGAGPRVALSRLTAPQHRNAIADTLAAFTPAPQDAEEATEPGLKAQYFESNGMNKADKLKMTRVDPAIEFDFDEASPGADITPEQFAIIWNGALHTEETGYYEFRITSENGVRLYLNLDNISRRGRLRDDSSVAGQAALIDAWVSSGKERVREARVFLLGGRAYPLRLEFFKYKDKTASIHFEWKTPHSPWATVDAAHLSTAQVPRLFVADTSFPADDRSRGYERGDAVSPEWSTATVNAAVQTAAEVVNRLPILANFPLGSEERDAKIRNFLPRFAERAFRRPLTDEEQDLFGRVLFETAPDADTAARRGVILALTAPSFLYVDQEPDATQPGPYTIASRLAFALWDSVPDEALLAAAASGALNSETGRLESATRMLDDPRTRAKVRDFFNHWLELEDRDLMKDPERFPDFDPQAIAALRRSLDLFVDSVVWSEPSDYRDLLGADFLYLDDRLAELYGDALEPEPEGSVFEFQKYRVDPNRRSGILTHPYLLSALAYHNQTSPIHRGVFLTRNIIGRGLRAPPIAVAFKDDEFPEDATMREKITQLTSDSACASCHSVINPLGFALENFDAIGRWRLKDKDHPVDTTTIYVTEEGRPLPLQSARDIAAFAAGNAEASRGFVVQLFESLVKQNPAGFGPGTIDALRLRFEEDNFNIQRLMAQIAARAAAGVAPSVATNENRTDL